MRRGVDTSRPREGITAKVRQPNRSRPCQTQGAPRRSLGSGSGRDVPARGRITGTQPPSPSVARPRRAARAGGRSGQRGPRPIPVGTDVHLACEWPRSIPALLLTPGQRAADARPGHPASERSRPWRACALVRRRAGPGRPRGRPITSSLARSGSRGLRGAATATASRPPRHTGPDAACRSGSAGHLAALHLTVSVFPAARVAPGGDVLVAASTDVGLLLACGRGMRPGRSGALRVFPLLSRKVLAAPASLHAGQIRADAARGRCGPWAVAAQAGRHVHGGRGLSAAPESWFWITFQPSPTGMSVVRASGQSDVLARVFDDVWVSR